jgi:hypothetical protein
MSMSASAPKELIRCSICNKVVPKQQYCPKCGKLLIKNFKNPPVKDKETDQEKNAPNQIEEETTNNTEQLDILRTKFKKSEEDRRENLEKESMEGDMLSGSKKEEKASEENMVKNIEINDIVLDDTENIKEAGVNGFVFTPDKYTVDTVQKIAKNVRYESYLVDLLKSDEMNEETFLGLYKGIADDTHRLIQRRGEIITEIETAIKTYKSTITAAQHGMKLLDIRKSIDDASDEEYKVKSAAFKWDINHYGGKISSEEQKASYLKNLGSLIDSRELDDLISDVNSSIGIASKLNVSEEVKGKIQTSMREALSLLKETSGVR